MFTDCPGWAVIATHVLAFFAGVGVWAMWCHMNKIMHTIHIHYDHREVSK